jgi:small-conductance mechanosensitive channel
MPDWLTLEALAGWLGSPAGQDAMLSVLLVALGLAAYFFLHRRLRRSDPAYAMGRTRGRFLPLAAAVALFFGLLIIWQSHLEELPVLGRYIGHARFKTSIENLFWTSILAVVLYLLILVARRVLLANTSDIESRHRVRSLTHWTGIGIFMVGAFVIWAADGIADTGVFFGLVGAGVALSLQETLLCMAGWLLVITKRPFDIGDRIEIKGHKGDVIDISVFQVSLLEVGNWVEAEQSTGRMLVVPNSAFFREEAFNYTKGFPFIWNEFSTVVTFESDWLEAKEIMLAQAQEEADKLEEEVKRKIGHMQRHYAIHYDRLRPIVYTSIAPNGVQLTLRYLSPVRRRRDTTHRISEGVLRSLIDHPRIDFAYPTTRFFEAWQEGKPAMHGSAKQAPNRSRKGRDTASEPLFPQEDK